MTQSEFLEQLRTALSSSLSAAAVQDNIEYYRGYISDEIRKGKTEEEVLEMLGDPWILARTIQDAQDGTDRSTVYEAESQSQQNYGYEDREEQGAGRNIHMFRTPPWWKIVLVVLGIIFVIGVVISLITGLISLLAPVLVPVLIVLVLIRYVNGRRR